MHSEYLANLLLATRAEWHRPMPAALPAPASPARFVVPAAHLALRACPLCAVRHAGHRCTR